MSRVSAAAHGGAFGARASSLLAAAMVATLGLEPTPAAARGYPSRFDNDPPRAEPARDWGAQPRSSAASRAGRRRDGASSARDAKRAETGALERPLFAVISIADQRVSIYNHHGLVERSAISTGVPGHPTPKGVFTIIGRERFHRSNLYSGAPMPFMQRITWSGIAMHLGVVPGRPASHGCIRLPAGFAARLWGLTRIGERVVIAPHDVAPAEFAHPLLPAPKMQVQAEADRAAPEPGAPQSVVDVQPPLLNPRQYAERLKAKAVAEAAAAATAMKEASAAIPVEQREAARAAAELAAAEAAHAAARARADAAAEAFEAAAAGAAQDATPAAGLAEDAASAAKTKADAELAEAAAKLDAAKTAAAAEAAEAADAVRRSSDAKAAAEAAVKAEKEAQLRLSPLSVLVSKKDRKIYVRQGLTPLFEAPATVREPETPLGSHLYIATVADGTSLKWTVVSMPAQGGDEQRNRHRTKTASIDQQVGAPPKPYRSHSTAAEALERIEIGQDVRDRIAERLWTGGSLIISDQPLSGETSGVGTDLTVKLR